MKGILLAENGDLMVRNGSLVIGNNAVQCAGLVLQMNQGELKEEPVVGANLLHNLRGKINRHKLKNEVEIALVRANINIQEVKNELELFINKQEITI